MVKCVFEVIKKVARNDAVAISFRSDKSYVIICHISNNFVHIGELTRIEAYRTCVSNARF